MNEIFEVLKREFVYVWYYFWLQLRQIFPYWILGMVIGSVISVFVKDKIHGAVSKMGEHKRGGTIPLLQQWLYSGMSIGSAASFMLTGPSTKITNLGALKIVLGMRNFILYLAFIMLFSLICGFVVNLISI